MTLAPRSSRFAIELKEFCFDVNKCSNVNLQKKKCQQRYREAKEIFSRKRNKEAAGEGTTEAAAGGGPEEENKKQQEGTEQQEREQREKKKGETERTGEKETAGEEQEADRRERNNKIRNVRLLAKMRCKRYSIYATRGNKETE
ncbi:hypothetical protein AVEN_60519-1 [Araneus ventricosus]|uniref:Uncharacterized protein n=1 Tax=Araneus ventricosus TaxID=182803 RepID=A0A4Y2FT01_ARAVE|nr:hypothetical protein AVEN_60519-1 [Araneus ventricosus]